MVAVRLTDDQRRLLEDLERVVANPGKVLSPYARGALKALDMRIHEGQSAPPEERERVNALLRKAGV
jgi:hypothetical protein